MPTVRFRKTVDAEVELKPCPFCGGEELDMRNAGSADLFRVACVRCNLFSSSGYLPDEAARRWNTRTQFEAARCLEIAAEVADVYKRYGFSSQAVAAAAVEERIRCTFGL